MTLYSQTETTTGIVYGKMMRDSRITLADGTFTFVHKLASQLIDCGVKADFEKLMANIATSGQYGDRDNIFTRVQIFRKGSGSGNHLYGHDYDTTLMYNRWKEIMGGLSFVEMRFIMHINHDVIGTETFNTLLVNPRNGIERIQRAYDSFNGLPQLLREEFLGMLGSYPCFFYHAVKNTRPASLHVDEVRESVIVLDDITPNVQDILSRMRADVPELGKGYQRNLEFAIRLLSMHNICVAKGDIVAEEIGDLVRFDTKDTPTEWKSATLDRRVITAERVAELNEMLSRQIASAR